MLARFALAQGSCSALVRGVCFHPGGRSVAAFARRATHWMAGTVSPGEGAGRSSRLLARPSPLACARSRSTLPESRSTVAKWPEALAESRSTVPESPLTLAESWSTVTESPLTRAESRSPVAGSRPMVAASRSTLESLGRPSQGLPRSQPRVCRQGGCMPTSAPKFRECSQRPNWNILTRTEPDL